MPDIKEFLTGEMQKHLDAANEVVAEAEATGRNLTEEEQPVVKDHLAKATELKQRLAGIEEAERMRKSIDDLGSILTGDPEAPSGEPARDLGDAFVRSDQYKALKARGMTGRWTTGPIEIDLKANTGIVAFTEGANEDLNSFPQRVPGIQGPVEERLTVANLLGQGRATASSIVFLKETATDNAAASVAEGDTKPASYLEFVKDTASVIKIATHLPVSDEMLEDEQQMRSYLNERLALFVRQEQERQLLYGNGTTELPGLIPNAGDNTAASDISGDNFFDGIMSGITSVRLNAGLEPDAMVIHPTDFAKISVVKATGGGNYYSGGPYAGPAQNPWGLRTVVTAAIEEGRALVGAFRQGATLWTKGGLTVEASNSHSDYFVKNLTAIRAEVRNALTIYRTAAFVLVREGS